jgi:hypothetical protein
MRGAVSPKRGGDNTAEVAGIESTIAWEECKMIDPGFSDPDERGWCKTYKSLTKG